MDRMDAQEMISALADGQLQGDALERGVQLAAADPAAREAWERYHLIGDVLRSADLARGSPPQRFLGRLQSRLRAECFAEFPESVKPAAALAASTACDTSRPAANESSWKWKWVAGYAAVAAVTAIGWNFTTSTGSASQVAGAEVQAVPGQLAAAGAEGGMIRDPQLDEFLAAHRQLGSGTALHTPAGFLRNATFEGPAR